MNARETGNIGEDFTARFLKEKGCEIVARNFTVRGGELDIVAKKGSVLHIVEVKTRKPGALSSGDEAITPDKISHIIRAANEFVRKNGLEISCVFDVAIVELNGKIVTGFRYIQRAFTA